MTAARRRSRLVILLSLVALAICTIFASSGHLSGVEYSLMQSIYSWPAGLTPLFIVITQLGSAWCVLGVVLSLVLTKAYSLAIKLAVASATTYLVVELLKNVIARPRPYILYDWITAREGHRLGYGFPSGHTAMATVLVLILWSYFPKRYKWLGPSLILLVAVSRIYLGVHAPLDVVGGALVGLIIVNLQKLLLEKNKT